MIDQCKPYLLDSSVHAHREWISLYTLIHPFKRSSVYTTYPPHKFAQLTYRLGPSPLGNNDTDALAGSLRHRDEHVMIVRNILLGRLKQAHLGQDTQSQSHNSEMDLAESEATTSQHIR